MKRQLSILLNLFLLLALSACGAARQPSRLPNPNDVKALLVQLVDVEKRAPAIVVGMIAADPQERWVVGYGRLSATDQRVPDGDTVFELASIGKVFTGILLAQAVLNGEVKLDDPISMYLPEGVTAPEYEGRSITLLDLTTHTSGLPRNGIEQEYSSTLDQMYTFLSGYRLTRAPGSAFEYSNYGFGLLGNLLVQAAGQEDYEALLLERITRPMGIDNTHIGFTPEMRSRLAPPHANYSDPAPSLDAPTFAGDGAGLRSTANDMLKFLAANMGLTETELQPALQLANTPQRPIYGIDYIGLGWFLPKSGNGIHWHDGANPGYSTYLAWDPGRNIGVVVLANSRISIDDLGCQLMRGAPKTLPVDPQILSAYAGRYQGSDGVIVTIRASGSRIFLQLPNHPTDYELFASSENQFYWLLSETEITFYRNEDGEVDRLVLAHLGDTHEAKKIP